VTELDTRAAPDTGAVLAEGFRRPDVAEGVASYLERRAPDFRGLGAADRNGGAS
jgi:hypothetical protein